MTLTKMIRAEARAMINMISSSKIMIAFFVRQTFSLEVKDTFYNKKARTSSVDSNEQEEPDYIYKMSVSSSCLKPKMVAR